MLSFLSALCVSLVVANSVDPKYAVNLTLYHVNEANYTGIANMDTGDVSGDAFFSLRSLYLPIECASTAGHHFSGDCGNPEMDGSNLTVTKVLVEVDSRYGGYSECNVCINSTVPFTKNLPCNDGDYVCVCGPFGHFSTDCPPTVGKETPASVFGRWPMRPDSPNFEWWLRNLLERLDGGLWYSTPATGECTPSGTGACYWREVQKQRRIKKDCQDDYIFKQITTHDPACFSGCPQPTNTSSTCIIDCIFSTLLGANSNHTNTTGTGTGLSSDKIVDIWQFPIDNDETKGGCPSY